MAYILGNNYYAAQVPQDKRENWSDGPNSGQDLGADGFVKPNTQLYTPEGMSAQTQATIIGGGLGVSILMPGAATLVLGETGGALFVGGAGLLGSGYGVYDGAGALGEWIGSENLSIVEKLELSLRIGNAALGAVTGPFAGLGLFRSGNSLLNSADSLPNPYLGIKEASAYLKSVGVPRDTRLEILQSFNPENMSVNVAGDAVYGLRFYNLGDNPFGHYLFPTFTNQTTRTGMAILPKWNSMTGIHQFQIKPGSIYLQGTAAPQGLYPGGAQQIFTFPVNLIQP